MSRDDLLDELSRTLLGDDYAGLTPAQQSVIDLISEQTPSAIDPLLRTDARTRWERLADQVAAFGGSWRFLGGFAAALLLYTAINLALQPFGQAFDPYPFIFLNLVLSTLAAVQAPVIMMSQNRQATRDREAAEHDYRVNLRAELEIMQLHDKLDRIRATELHNAISEVLQEVHTLKTQLATLKTSQN